MLFGLSFVFRIKSSTASSASSSPSLKEEVESFNFSESKNKLNSERTLINEKDNLMKTDRNKESAKEFVESKNTTNKGEFRVQLKKTNQIAEKEQEEAVQQFDFRSVLKKRSGDNQPNTKRIISAHK